MKTFGKPSVKNANPSVGPKHPVNVPIETATLLRKTTGQKKGEVTGEDTS